MSLSKLCLQLRFIPNLKAELCLCHPKFKFKFVLCKKFNFKENKSILLKFNKEIIRNCIWRVYSRIYLSGKFLKLGIITLGLSTESETPNFSFIVKSEIIFNPKILLDPVRTAQSVVGKTGTRKVMGSNPGKGRIFRSEFELQYIQPAWQSIRMSPSVHVGNCKCKL